MMILHPPPHTGGCSMTLIRATTITYVVDVPETDIRAALILEAAEKHGLTHDGKLIPRTEG